MEKWKPKYDERYYISDFTFKDWWDYNIWVGDSIDNILYNRGLVFKTKEEAVKKAKEICGIYEIDGVEYTRGEMVLVRDYSDNIWREEIFLENRGYKIVCVSGMDEKRFNNSEYYDTWSWNQIKKLDPKPLEVTMEEVCKKFGCEVKIKKD